MRVILRRASIRRELATLRLEAAALRAAALIIETAASGDPIAIRAFVDEADRRMSRIEQGRYRAAVSVGFVLGVAFSTAAYALASVG